MKNILLAAVLLNFIGEGIVSAQDQGLASCHNDKFAFYCKQGE